MFGYFFSGLYTQESKFAYLIEVNEDMKINKAIRVHPSRIDYDQIDDLVEDIKKDTSVICPKEFIEINRDWTGRESSVSSKYLLFAFFVVLCALLVAHMTQV